MLTLGKTFGFVEPTRAIGRDVDDFEQNRDRALEHAAPIYLRPAEAEREHKRRVAEGIERMRAAVAAGQRIGLSTERRRAV